MNNAYGNQMRTLSMNNAYAHEGTGIPTIHAGTEASVEGRTREPPKRRPLPRGGEGFEEPKPEPTERLLAGIPKEEHVTKRWETGKI
jgi:hypothetical protein